MTIKQKLEKLALENNSPCVTISLNTHRTRDKSSHDDILLKNLLSEARKQVLEDFDKREISSLLEKIDTIQSKIDMRFNLDSLHIFLSNQTEEYIRSPWSISEDSIQVHNRFNIRHIIKKMNRSTEYLILVLSQGGGKLYEAINDNVEREVRNEDFPFEETPFYTAGGAESSNAKLVDDLAKEYLNRVDKALQNVVSDTELPCVVIATEDNYTKLMQVADNPGMYIGFDNKNYNEIASHVIAQQGWKIMEENQKVQRRKAIEEMKEAVSQGKVLTDLQEIFQASVDGRGELLIVHQDFSQAVVMNSDERTFSLTDNPAQADVIDDITGNIAWNVLSKKGRVVFTTKDEIKELGNIALKIRY